MGTRHLAIPLLTAVVVACGHRRSARVYDHTSDGTIALSHAFLNPVQLRGRLLVNDPIIGNPRSMAINGGTLWISDRAGEPYLHAINIRSGQLFQSRGRHGEGPGDFSYAPLLMTRPGDTTAVWAYDGGLRRMSRVDSGAAPTRVMPSQDQQVSTIWSQVWITDRTRVGVGNTDTNRFVFSDTTGRLIRLAVGALLGADSVPAAARWDASSGFALCASPRARRIAIAFIYAGRIDILDDSAKVVASAAVPFPDSVRWVRARNGQVFPDRSWYYYQDCVATPTRLYALFDGHRTDGPGRGRTSAARYVHVFDWSGRLVSVLGLDHEASAIAVSGDTLLFASGQSGDGVFAYTIARGPSPDTDHQ